MRRAKWLDESIGQLEGHRSSPDKCRLKESSANWPLNFNKLEIGRFVSFDERHLGGG